MALEDLVLAPNYAVFGKNVTYTPSVGAASTIRVIDETAGKKIESDGPGSPFDIVPAVNVRLGDVAANPVGDMITMDSSTWKITRTLPVVGPSGAVAGELTLILELQ